jgi:pyridoxamine 5'-phosphate oxidase
MVNRDAFERVHYEVPGLADDEVAADPLTQFQRWLDEATTAGVKEPTAMSLATCGPQGAAVRMVLAKAVDRDGVVFYTNLSSDKAVEIGHDPRVALLFAWMPQHRQVRFTGIAELLPRPIVQEYFDTRPRGAQIGAWASPQSQALSSRGELAARVADVEERLRFTAQRPGVALDQAQDWRVARLAP